jgi:hypothetical protein
MWTNSQALQAMNPVSLTGPISAMAWFARWSPCCRGHDTGTRRRLAGDPGEDVSSGSRPCCWATGATPGSDGRPCRQARRCPRRPGSRIPPRPRGRLDQDPPARSRDARLRRGATQPARRPPTDGAAAMWSPRRRDAARVDLGHHGAVRTVRRARRRRSWARDRQCARRRSAGSAAPRADRSGLVGSMVSKSWRGCAGDLGERPGELDAVGPPTTTTKVAAVALGLVRLRSAASKASRIRLRIPGRPRDS